MAIGYCIAAHTRPAQCWRLVRRLLDDDPHCRVFVHYDQRHSPFDASQLAGSRVKVIPERPVYWGSSRIVDLYVDMFCQAMSEGCSYMVMLSGQDYPLRHVGGLEAELAAYDVWADAEPLYSADGSCRWPEGRRRYSYRWWHFDHPSKLTMRADRFAEKVLRVPWSRSEPPLPYVARSRMAGQVWWGIRAHGPGVPIHTGSMWMSLSVAAVETILAAPKRTASFFHHVPIADEAYFHTVLRNANGLRFAPGNARYLRFSEAELHPEVLTAADLGSMVSSGAHFGRKFDDEVDSSVLEYLDTHSSEPAPAAVATVGGSTA